MGEWTTEATEYLEGYLKQVSALAKQQGDNADGIVGGLRDQIAREAASIPGTTVDLDALFALLAKIGSPEKVVGAGGPAYSESPYGQPPVASPVSPLPPPPSPQQVAPAKKSSMTGCSIGFIVVCVILFFAVPVVGTFAAIMLPALARAREAARRVECQNNLKQLGIGLKIYASEKNGSYPAMADEFGRLMFNADDLYPEYIPDAAALLCPSGHIEFTDPVAAIDDHAYYYFSHVILSDKDAKRFAEEYVAAHQQVANGQSTAEELTNQISLPALHDDMERDTSTPPASEIPVLLERPTNHVPDGGNVLYLDGHVEFIRLNQKFPMTDSFLSIIESIDR